MHIKWSRRRRATNDHITVYWSFWNLTLLRWNECIFCANFSISIIYEHLFDNQQNWVDIWGISSSAKSRKTLTLFSIFRRKLRKISVIILRIRIIFCRNSNFFVSNIRIFRKIRSCFAAKLKIGSSNDLNNSTTFGIDSLQLHVYL